MKNIPCASEFLDKDGYAVVHSMVKTPLYNQDGKIEAILTMISDSTKSTHVKELHDRYKQAYKDNSRLGNRKFLEYLGLSSGNFTLTNREIECLICLSQKRQAQEIGKELGIEENTVHSHLNTIKYKLDCPNLSKVLIYFVTYNHRKF